MSTGRDTKGVHFQLCKITEKIPTCLWCVARVKRA